MYVADVVRRNADPVEFIVKNFGPTAWIEPYSSIRLIGKKDQNILAADSFYNHELFNAVGNAIVAYCKNNEIDLFDVI